MIFEKTNFKSKQLYWLFAVVFCSVFILLIILENNEFIFNSSKALAADLDFYVDAKRSRANLPTAFDHTPEARMVVAGNCIVTREYTAFNQFSEVGL